MNTQGILATILFVTFCMKSGQGLECYHHDLCLDKCPDLTKVFVKCEHEENECWKATTPFGIKRGCGNNRCGLQFNVGIVNTASVCCSDNHCNSSIQVKLATIPTVFMSLITFVYTWYLE